MLKSQIPTLLFVFLWLAASQEFCGTSESPKSCVPSWMLIGENVRKVNVTSTCGQDRLNEICNDRGVCETCTQSSHPPSHLIDPRDPENKTCWVSGRVRPDFASQEAVNITIPFDKRFEIFYISLEGCLESLEDFPDSIAIYKSTDFQKTWKPWHYFSKNCPRAFNMPTSDDFTSFKLFGVYCSSIRPTLFKDPNRVTRDEKGRLFGGNKQTYSRAITFSTKIGRQINSQWSPILNDWMSATDIRLSLWKNRKDNLIKRSITFKKTQDDRSRIDSGDFIALSNIKIAGRCQCNGHASECVAEPKDGQIKFRCKCQHNTDGEDCERCKASHMDIPWHRSTPNEPTVCKSCNCNLHSETCRFSNTKYIKSNKSNGGVCDNCRDNTTGDNCELCAEGYYRDWSKPLSHKDVCLPCNCSPNGSLSSRACNSTSGQCFCKDGVSGQFCNRCSDGFTFTNNPQQPCIPIVDTIVPVQKAQQTMPCSTCYSTRERISLRRYCKKDMFFVGIVTDLSFVDDMVRLDVTASVLWKMNLEEQYKPTNPYFPKWSYLISLNETQLQSSFNPYSLDEVRIKDVTVPIWLSLKDYRCSCPSAQMGQAYLFGLNFNGYFNKATNRQELLINQASVVIPWREAWTQRLNKLRYRTNQGACNVLSRIPRGQRNRPLFRRNVRPFYLRGRRHMPVYRYPPVAPNAA